MLSFNSLNSSFLFGEKYDGSNFTPTHRLLLQDQIMLIRIWLIELTEPYDTLNYKPLFKHCILQIILHVFLLFISLWSKIFCSQI